MLHRISKTEIDQYLVNDLSKIPDQYKEICMSAALYYRQEGRQERTFSIAKNMLHEGSEPSFIERVTGLPMEAIRGLQIA